MPSDLDLKLNALMADLIRPGGRMEIGRFVRGGVELPAFTAAPPSLPALFDHFCLAHGEDEFIVDGPVRLSFAQTHALARRGAQALIARHGIARGDRVGIAMPNSAAWMIAYMAVLMAGGCATLLNGWWTGPELCEGVRLAGCKLVLADTLRAGRLEGLDHGAELVTADIADPATRAEDALAAIVVGGASDPLPVIGPDDLATIVFTSGSTGTCKGAVSDHRALVQATLNFVAQSLAVYGFLAQVGPVPQGQQSALCQMPLFHVTGEVPVFLQSIVLGRRLVVMRRWDAAEAMRLIEAERLHYFVGVPMMSHEMALHPDRASFDLSSCRTMAAGGAPRPPEHLPLLQEAFPHARPIMGYGLTETNCLGCNNLGPNYIAKPASTGPAARPLVELAVFDEAGAPLPVGTPGEIAIRSVANVLGYWDDPEATASAFRPDGWFLSGDLGYLDEDGYLFIVDRKKDIIIRGGENIACVEVEQALYAHPAVAEACVFGLPDWYYGEVPAAVVFLKPGRAAAQEALQDFLATRIARFKIPVQVWIAEEPLPRLGSEKVDKRGLKARYSEQWERAKA